MTTTMPEPKTASGGETAAARQFVNFMFFRIDRSFRGQNAELKVEAKREFASIVQRS